MLGHNIDAELLEMLGKRRENRCGGRVGARAATVTPDL